MRPAIRFVFAPIFKRDKVVRNAGLNLHGKAEGRTITLDPRGADNFLDTIVHEMTHVRHPDWTEKMVQEHTKLRMKKMGWKERARILKLLGNAIIEGE